MRSPSNSLVSWGQASHVPIQGHAWVEWDSVLYDQGLGQFALAAQIACDGRRGAHSGHCVHDVIQIISRAAHARESGDVSGRLRRRGLFPKLLRVVFGCC